MIHIPTALENQIRATVVNRRHLNNRFRIEVTTTSSLMVDQISVYSNTFKPLVIYGTRDSLYPSVSLWATTGYSRCMVWDMWDHYASVYGHLIRRYPYYRRRTTRGGSLILYLYSTAIRRTSSGWTFQRQIHSCYWVN